MNGAAMKPLSLDLRERIVGVHHPDAFGLAVFFLHSTHAGLDGAHIGAVPDKHLEAERQALRRAIADSD